MSRYMKLWALLAAGLSMLACEREELDFVDPSPVVKSGETQLTFTATIDGAETRTTLEGSKIAWNAGEEINIFYGASPSNRFVSTNTETTQSVTFTGTLTAFTGTTEDDEPNSFWAIYPYNAGNTSSGSSVSAWLPDTQEGVLGNIPDKTLMMVAKTPGLSLSFKQVCARLKVRVSRSDIRKIVISGNNGETLAGRVRIAMNGNVPEWSAITGEGSTEIVLNPSGTTFEEGEYYLALLPQTLSAGFTITCCTDELEGSYSTGAVTFERNQIKTVNTNKVTEWVPRTTQLPNEIWYTSTDGNPVDYVVTAATGNEIVSNTYANGQGVIRFASDVTVIDANAFRTEVTLASVTLPENVDKISRNAFSGCTNLREVNMGDNVRIIAEYAFYDCVFPRIHLSENLRCIGASAFAFNHSLEEVHIPESVTSLGYKDTYEFYFYDNIFAGCASLRKFTGKFATEDGLCLLYGNGAGLKNILVSVAPAGISGTFRVPDGVEAIVISIFDQASITSVDLNAVSVIYDYAFRGSKLQSITIPSTVERIRESAFSHCNDMTDMWFESAPLPRLDENALGRLDDEQTNFTIHIPGIANARSGGALLYETYSIEVDGQTQQIHSYWYDYRMETERIDVYQPDDEIWYHKSGNDIYFNYYSMNFGTAASPVKETLFGPFYMTDYPRFTANADVPGDSEFEWIGVLKFDGPVTSIPERAFYSKAEMDWISLPSTVEAIHDEAFAFCSALTFIKGDNVTFLGASAFVGCTLLSGFNFYKVENVQACCFMDCGNLYVASLPEAWFIGGSAFRGCNKLMVVALAAIQTIGNQAFAYTRNMYVMILGPNLASVGDLVFYDDDASLRNSGKLQILFFGNPAPEISDPQDAAWTWTDAFAYEVAGQAPYFQFGEIGISSTLWDEWDANGNLDDFQQMVEAHFGGSSIIVPKEVE